MKMLRDVIGKELVSISKSNDKVVVIDCDMAKHTKISHFLDMFPERSYEVGICEQNGISIAAGMASCGKIPVVSSFSAFIGTRAWEQIRHSIAYNEMNVKIFASHSGLSASEDGGTHQCLEDFALMTVLPNMIVLSPADSEEAKQVIKYAINHYGPVYIRVGRNEVEDILPKDYNFKIGEPVLLSDGKDVAIISTGEILREAIRAKMKLRKSGVNAKVIHLPSLKPLNYEYLISLLIDCKYLVTVEEHSIYGGLASIIALHLLDKITIKKFRSLGMKTFGESGQYSELIGKFGLDSESIKQTVLELIEEK